MGFDLPKNAAMQIANVNFDDIIEFKDKSRKARSANREEQNMCPLFWNNFYLIISICFTI